MVLKNAGTQFDQELARAFLKCIGLFPAGVLVELNTEQLAVVIKGNDADPDRPLVLMVTDRQHQRLKKPILADLGQEAHSGLTILHEVMNGTSGIDVKHYIDQRLFA